MSTPGLLGTSLTAGGGNANVVPPTADYGRKADHMSWKDVMNYHLELAYHADLVQGTSASISAVTALKKFWYLIKESVSNVATLEWTEVVRGLSHFFKEITAITKAQVSTWGRGQDVAAYARVSFTTSDGVVITMNNMMRQVVSAMPAEAVAEFNILYNTASTMTAMTNLIMGVHDIGAQDVQIRAIIKVMAGDTTGALTDLTNALEARVAGLTRNIAQNIAKGTIRKIEEIMREYRTTLGDGWKDQIIDSCKKSADVKELLKRRLASMIATREYIAYMGPTLEGASQIVAADINSDAIGELLGYTDEDDFLTDRVTPPSEVRQARISKVIGAVEYMENMPANQYEIKSGKFVLLGGYKKVGVTLGSPQTWTINLVAKHKKLLAQFTQ